MFPPFKFRNPFAGENILRMYVKTTLMRSLNQRKGLITFFAINSALALLLLYLLHLKDPEYFQCYTNDCDPPIYLPLDQSTVEPSGDQNIFFLETRAHFSKISVLKPRQACTIEAAAKMNPDWNIFIFILDENQYRMDALWNTIRLLSNVHVKAINAKTFAQGTPAEWLMLRGIDSKPEWRAAHMSDVLRYTTLYKYAGIYLDLDVIVLKPFSNLNQKNFAAQENAGDELQLGSAIIGFGADEIGRRMASLVVEDVAANFTGQEWTENGPGTLTRSVEKVCGTNNVLEANVKRCHGFKVLPPETFYAIPYSEFNSFFDEEKLVEGIHRIHPSIATHFWNFMSAGVRSTKDSKNVFSTLARLYCPSVYGFVENHL